MLRGLFEGAQYNSEAGAKCAVYSRARTKQGRGVIKEIRDVISSFANLYPFTKLEKGLVTSLHPFYPLNPEILGNTLCWGLVCLTLLILEKWFPL